MQNGVYDCLKLFFNGRMVADCSLNETEDLIGIDGVRCQEL